MESFGENYPDQYEMSLDSISLAVSCAFNSAGTLFAVGCNDGRIVIWDFVSRKIAKILAAHVHPVSSLQWSHAGFYLITSSTDNNVCKLSVLNDACDCKFSFPTPVMKVQMNPSNENQVLVSPLNHLPVLLSFNGTHECLPMNTEGDLNVLVTFDQQGNYIYTGNIRGRVAVFDINTLKVVASFRIRYSNGNTMAIKTIVFGPKLGEVVIATIDRSIRVYTTSSIMAAGQSATPEPKCKFQDIFNKFTWKRICFSASGEYICAGNTKHELYIWESSSCTLLKKLNTGKDDMLLDMAWHPQRPIIASVSSGMVTIWSQPQCENWQAYDPRFREIDENMVYAEQEGEFDIEDEDKSVHDDSNGDADVEDNLSDSGSEIKVHDDSNILTFMPISPEVEEDSPYEYRRK